VRHLPEVRDCNTIPEMIEHADQVCNELIAFIREIPLDYLEVKAYPEGWSASKNVTHAVGTLRLVSKWIGAPLWVIRLRGKSKMEMPSIKEVRPTNRPPRYDYGTYRAGKQSAESTREELARRLQSGFEVWKTAVQKRTEDEMENLKGAFERMNLRLFCMFAVKHAVFHLQVVRSRLESAGEAAPEPGLLAP
jgi:hypothetical protein